MGDERHSDPVKRNSLERSPAEVTRPPDIHGLRGLTNVTAVDDEDRQDQQKENEMADTPADILAGTPFPELPCTPGALWVWHLRCSGGGNGWEGGFEEVSEASLRSPLSAAPPSLKKCGGCPDKGNYNLNPVTAAILRGWSSAEVLSLAQALNGRA